MAQQKSINESDPLLLPLIGSDEDERERFSEELSNLVDRIVKKQKFANGTDVEDLRQDALLSILEQTKDEKLEKKPIANIFGYAVTSAINLCRKTFRKKDVEGISLDDEAYNTSSLRGVAAEAEQEIEILSREILQTIWDKAESELSKQQLWIFLLDDKNMYERLVSGVVSLQRLADALDLSRETMLEIEKKLPLKDKELAELLEIKTDKVYQLRFQVNKWLKQIKI